ncbi:hypothetical protein RHS01_08395 [Rhizoctonia solani]|uniref:Uncharacterized protein n=1 Tax=Rhizoctonia solani TaxID=456999 RepID=A0A8H7I803_9AGAM|nr:hypothetical protein RHS01_08395 [Rhizoctonia solani]
MFRGNPLPTTLLRPITPSATLARNGTGANHCRSPQGYPQPHQPSWVLAGPNIIQGQQLAELKAICKETNNLVGDKDQGGAQTKPGPLTGPVTLLPTQEGKSTLQAQLGLGSKPIPPLKRNRF